MTIKADRVATLPLVESMTIKVVRENRNPRDLGETVVYADEWEVINA
jgi:hypothetical protein